MPQFWNRGGAAKQRDALMNVQYTSGTGFAVKFSKKARSYRRKTPRCACSPARTLNFA